MPPAGRAFNSNRARYLRFRSPFELKLLGEHSVVCGPIPRFQSRRKTGNIMGAFYGVTYLRTDEIEPILAILTGLNHRNQTQFLVAPPLNQWIAVYSQHGGQDERIAASISKKFSGDVLHVLVHDDDIFCYTLFRRGRQIDSYNSCPDYFESVPARERKRLQGQPVLLAHLLPSPDELPALQKLISGSQNDSPLFASSLLEEFAGILRLPNAMTSYEYLMQGETESVEAWDEFIHIPDLTAKNAVKAALKKGHQSQFQSLRESGMLLFDMSIPTPPVCVPSSTGTGFELKWLSGTPIAWQQIVIEPPWSNDQKKPTKLGDANRTPLAASPSGRLAAYIEAYRPDSEINVFSPRVHCRITIQDPHEQADPQGTFELSDHVHWARFLSNEQQLLVLTQKAAVLLSLSSQSEIARIPVDMSLLAVLHPSEQFAVLVTATDLGILDLKNRTIRTIGLGQRASVPQMPQLQSMLKAQLDNIDLDALEKQMKAQFKKMKLPEAMAEKAITEQIERMRKLASGETPIPQHTKLGSETSRVVTFDPEGKLLCCATDAGIRVYDWEEFLLAEKMAPRPLFTVNASSITIESAFASQSIPATAQTLVVDPEGNHLLSGGMAGSIDYLDLNNGVHGTLLEIPGRPFITELILSRDGSALCSVTRPGNFDESSINAGLEVYVWDHRSLNERSRGGQLRVVR